LLPLFQKSSENGFGDNGRNSCVQDKERSLQEFKNVKYGTGRLPRR
jgi:hypothetical protein